MNPSPGRDNQVDALEITYVDPRSGNVCRKDVFCEPQQWEWRWQARFLISAELVNLLSEAYASRQERFRQAHGKLTQCRLGYLVDLWRLRRGIESIMQALPVEDLEQEQHPGAKEIGPVHFFIPDHYLDAWTVEHLAMATDVCRKGLQEEIHELVGRLNVIGGGNWPQLLDLILARGVALTAVAGFLMASCQDAEERRLVENHITGGLADRLEALRPGVEKFELEMQDFADRGIAVDQQLRQRMRDVDLLEQALEALRKRRQQKAETPAVLDLSDVRRSVKPDPVKEQRQLDESLQKLRAAWAAQLQQTSEDLERLRGAVADAKAELAGCHEEELQELERKAKALRQKAIRAESEAQKASAKAEVIRERVKSIEEQVAADDGAMSGLTRRLSEEPPADPRTFLYERLTRELKILQREEVAIRKGMLAPHTRIKAIRHGLRQLYRKLGWEWDLSDSDDDYNDKPYWERRKLATNGMAPFDARLFVYSEKTFQSRRLRRHEAKEKSQQQTTFLKQMTAKRHCAGGAHPENSTESPEDAADGVGPFKNHGGPVERDSTMSFHRATSSAANLRLEQRQRDSAELGQQRSKTVQLQELRSSFEGHLRKCISCFIDLLPSEGVLGEQRETLGDLLKQLDLLPADSCTWVDDAVGQQLDSISEALHNCIEEVASLGDHVHPVCGALQNSVEFGDLRQRLMELRADQRRLQSLSEAEQQQQQEQHGGAALGLQHQSAHAPRRVLISEWPDGDEPTMPSTPSKPSSAGPGMSRSTGALPQLVDPVSGGQGKAKRRRDLAKPEVVNFGFRPDGVGEDSLENWSLFKVSKGSVGFSGTTVDATSSTASFRATRSTSFLRDSTISNRFADSKTIARFQKVAADGDFREYMSQAQQGTQEMWRPASTPELLLAKKRGPSLPQLVSGAPKGNAAPEGQGIGDLLEGDSQARRAGQHGIRSRVVRASLRQATGGIGPTRR